MIAFFNVLVAGLGVALYTLFHPGIRRSGAATPEPAEPTEAARPPATVIHLKERKRA